jgi:hypothetical protein
VARVAHRKAHAMQDVIERRIRPRGNLWQIKAGPMKAWLNDNRPRLNRYCRSFPAKSRKKPTSLVRPGRSALAGSELRFFLG